MGGGGYKKTVKCRKNEGPHAQGNGKQVLIKANGKQGIFWFSDSCEGVFAQIKLLQPSGGSGIFFP